MNIGRGIAINLILDRAEVMSESSMYRVGVIEGREGGSMGVEGCVWGYRGGCVGVERGVCGGREGCVWG